MGSKANEKVAPQSCEFFEKDPLLQCKAYHDGYLVPNDQDMQEYCLDHPKQCCHYPKEQKKDA